MRTRWGSLASLALFVCIALFIFWALGYFEPRYNGQPASEYLRNLLEESNHFGAADDGPRIRAVPARVGVPILIRYTEAQDPRWRGWYQRLYPKLPQFLKSRLGPPESKDMLVLRSVIALRFYGAEAYPAVPRLMHMESNKLSRMPGAIPTVLGEMGPNASNAIPMLMTLITNHWQSAWDAGWALAKIDPAGARSGAFLISTLDRYLPRADGIYVHRFDPLTPLRSMATNNPKWINEVWNAAIESPHPQLLPRCVGFVCGFGALDDARFAVIMARTTNDDAALRQSAAAALRHTPERAIEALPRLIEMCRDGDSNVVRWARLSLWSYVEATNIGTALRIQALQSLSPFEEDYQWKGLAILRRMGPDALPLLKEVSALLRDPNERIRGVAAEAIAAMGPGAITAKPLLQPLLNDHWGFVREAAEQALRSIEGTNSPAAK